MGGQLSEAGERAVKFLSDGQWHSVVALVNEVAKAFPPGKAVRKVEYDRLYRRQRRQEAGDGVRSSPDRIRPTSTRAQVLNGQRRLAIHLLDGWARRGTIEFDGPTDEGAWTMPERRVRATQRTLARHLPKRPQGGDDAPHG